ncbi:MAG TPA: hypothetical protein VFR02_09280, partial [bacterium]|nr:hypothetical protein [bacterium]
LLGAHGILLFLVYATGILPVPDGGTWASKIALLSNQLALSSNYAIRKAKRNPSLNNDERR